MEKKSEESSVHNQIMTKFGKATFRRPILIY